MWPGTSGPTPSVSGDGCRGRNFRTGFGREDIVDAQWRIVQPVLGDATPLYMYQSGTWGPEEAARLIGGDGPWRDPRVTEAETKVSSDDRHVRNSPRTVRIGLIC